MEVQRELGERPVGLLSRTPGSMAQADLSHTKCTSRTLIVAKNRLYSRPMLLTAVAKQNAAPPLVGSTIGPTTTYHAQHILLISKGFESCTKRFWWPSLSHNIGKPTVASSLPCSLAHLLTCSPAWDTDTGKREEHA